MAETYTATKLSPMRKIIAARMTEAKQTIPHFRLAADIEVDALIDLRKELLGRNPGVLFDRERTNTQVIEVESFR